MSLKTTIQSYMGKGAPTAEFTLNIKEGQPLSLVKGKLEISGGEYDTPISSLYVYLFEQRFDKEKQAFKESKSKLAKLTMNDYTIEPGETISYPFQVEIPKGVSPSADTLMHEIRVEVNVKGKAVWAKQIFKVV